MALLEISFDSTRDFNTPVLFCNTIWPGQDIMADKGHLK